MSPTAVFKHRFNTTIIANRLAWRPITTHLLVALVYGDAKLRVRAGSGLFTTRRH